jgi:hypothetical protein
MAMVCEWFGLKTTRTVFTGLASKPVVMVSGDLISKSAVTVSPSFTPKPVVGFLVEPQNQGGGGFLGLDLKIGSFDLVILLSKPSRLWFVGCVTKPTEKGQCGTRVEI